MSYLSDKRIYYVNSANRESPSTSTHSNFSFKFDLPENKFDQVVVLDIAVPKSYYLIQDGRNTFQLSEGTSTATITVTAGNYSSTSFAKHVVSLLNTASPNHYTYTMTLNNQGKFDYEVKAPQSQPSITVTTNVYEQLGFEPNTENKFVNNLLVSVNCVDFQRESTLFLRSNMIATGTGDNVLQQVFTESTSDFGNITYKCEDVIALAKPLIPNSSNVYNFYLTNENDEKIDTNGRNLVFTLMFFKKSFVNENMNQLVKQTLKFIQDYRNRSI